MTAHDLLTCASHETESSNLVRGMSVSRRSSRFGEHPCADLLPVYWKVFSSIQFRGCCASDVSVACPDRHRLWTRVRRCSSLRTKTVSISLSWNWETFAARNAFRR